VGIIIFSQNIRNRGNGSYNFHWNFHIPSKVTINTLYLCFQVLLKDIQIGSFFFHFTIFSNFINSCIFSFELTPHIVDVLQDVWVKTHFSETISMKSLLAITLPFLPQGSTNSSGWTCKYSILEMSKGSIFKPGNTKISHKRYRAIIIWRGIFHM